MWFAKYSRRRARVPASACYLNSKVFPYFFSLAKLARMWYVDAPNIKYEGSAMLSIFSSEDVGRWCGPCRVDSFRYLLRVFFFSAKTVIIGGNSLMFFSRFLFALRRTAFMRPKLAWRFVWKMYKIVRQFFKVHWLPLSTKTVRLGRWWWQYKPKMVITVNRGKSFMIYWRVMRMRFTLRTAHKLNMINIEHQYSSRPSTDPMDYFLLNAKTGALHTARPLDREALPDATGLIVLTVRVNQFAVHTPIHFRSSISVNWSI